MDLLLLSRVQVPPAPETLALRRLRFLGAGMCGLSAILIACAGPIADIDRRLVLVIGAIMLVTVAINILVWRRRRAWNRSWWTEERRARHLMQVCERERDRKPPKGEAR
ncbi:hypothetical protein [Aquamicrobium sp.]|uniref:hypothetical protein n=1 Tax=Aquamicrobium sp. TaxID=1872579 RepID=UPI00258B84B5|nr:hypothetical protein [Aquamicrobium sp.]MCK9553906.1 hypothetical protein [Aquamicrobium sp.]